MPFAVEEGGARVPCYGASSSGFGGEALPHYVPAGPCSCVGHATSTFFSMPSSRAFQVQVHLTHQHAHIFCPGSCEKGLAVCLIFKAIMDECTHTSHSTAVWEVLFGGICSTDYWKVCPTSSQLPREEVSGESCLHLIHWAHLGFDHCRFFTALIFLPKCDGPLVLLS